MVLHRCEKQLGHSIPEDDLKAGRLDKWLRSEDFNALPVSFSNKLSIPPCPASSNVLVGHLYLLFI